MTLAYTPTPLSLRLTRSLETIQSIPPKNIRQSLLDCGVRELSVEATLEEAKFRGRRYVARAGQFILSRIDARHGANGIVPDELSGAIVTNDFPVFNFDHSRLEPKYLQWLGRTHDFIQLCLRASEGTTNRVRLSEERFLDLPIPLPTVEEQAPCGVVD